MLQTEQAMVQEHTNQPTAEQGHLAAQICGTEQKALIPVSAKTRMQTRFKVIVPRIRVSGAANILGCAKGLREQGVGVWDMLPVTAGDRMWQGSTAQLHIPVLQQELCPLLIVLLHLVPIRNAAGTLGLVISSSPQGQGPDGENVEKGREKDHSSLQFFLNWFIQFTKDKG